MTRFQITVLALTCGLMLTLATSSFTPSKAHAQPTITAEGEAQTTAAEPAPAEAQAPAADQAPADARALAQPAVPTPRAVRAMASAQAGFPAQAPAATPAAASATPTAAPAAAPAASSGAVVAAGAAAAATAEPAKPGVHNTWNGVSGGVRVVDAFSGVPGSVRLQLAADMFTTTDFMLAGDENDYFGSTLSGSVTAIEHLEVFASIHSHSNGNTMERPQLLQVLGDLVLGAKGYFFAMPWLSLGGDLRLHYLNSVGGIGPAFKSMSIGLRGLVSADLRELEGKSYPVILRGSLDYFFDNSSLLIDSVEDARYAAIGADRRSRHNEDRHLIRRVERFALTIQRNDMLSFGLGVELPLPLGKNWFLHPIVEWQLGIPVNRQGYNCLLVAADTGPGDPDGCLSVEGLSAMPSSFTFAARLVPPKVPVSFLMGFDVGATGVSTFVRELAPNRPWAFLIGVEFSAEPQEPIVREVVVQAPVRALPAPLPRIHGTIADASTGAGIEGAVVRYLDRELTSQSTAADGTFISYPLDGSREVRIEVSHPKYAPALCSATLPASMGPSSASAASPARPTGAMTSGSAPASAGGASGTYTNGGATVAELQLNPYLHKSTGLGGGLAPMPAPTVELRCEMTPQVSHGVLQGQVVGPEGEAVLGAQVMLTGPSSQLLTTDARGLFSAPDLPAGSYSVRVEGDGYLIKLLTVDVAAETLASVHVVLMPKPTQAQVELTQEEVRIRSQIFFAQSKADISERSNGLLTEIADVLLRNPHVAHVEVQGHTDNSGVPAQNKELSQARAEAVVKWLIGAGIASDRLTARGYGDERPLVPNITERNRARNRRVQFMIRQ